jgi:hypothetical protein
VISLRQQPERHYPVARGSRSQEQPPEPLVQEQPVQGPLLVQGRLAQEQPEQEPLEQHLEQRRLAQGQLAQEQLA